MSAGRGRREDEAGRGEQSSRAATRAAAAASVAHERPQLVGITPNQPRSDALSALAFDGPQGAPRRSTRSDHCPACGPAAHAAAAAGVARVSKPSRRHNTRLHQP